MNSKSAAAFGIAGFVVLLISLVIPVYGIHVGVIALLIVTVAGLAGERIFALTTVILSAVKLLFLSPTAKLYAYLNGVDALIVLGAALHILPIAAMVFVSMRGKPENTTPEKPKRPY